MRTKQILEFLAQLEHNNTLEYMKANKSHYNTAKKNFEDFLQKLIDSITSFDESVRILRPQDLVFRLNRDTRFSKDKSPYNPSFRAHISSAGRTPIPAGYYINIKPGCSFLGGGLFATAFPNATTMVRDYIVTHSEEWNEILKSSQFSDNFTIVGSKLKNVPRGYDKESTISEWLKHKSWDIEIPLSDTQFTDEKTNIQFISEKFKLMKPFNDYLNKALVDFKMPTR